MYVMRAMCATRYILALSFNWYQGGGGIHRPRSLQNQIHKTASFSLSLSLFGLWIYARESAQSHGKIRSLQLAAGRSAIERARFWCTHGAHRECTSRRTQHPSASISRPARAMQLSAANWNRKSRSLARSPARSLAHNESFHIRECVTSPTKIKTNLQCMSKDKWPIFAHQLSAAEREKDALFSDAKVRSVTWSECIVRSRFFNRQNRSLKRGEGVQLSDRMN